MKYFTPELLDRFASADDAIALAAQDELEQRSAAYAEHLSQIDGRLPPRFRELLARYYLHDAHVTSARKGLTVEGASFWLAVQLDTPPREFLILHYRGARVEQRPPSVTVDECPNLEWLHDEAGIAASSHEFSHAILFSNGIELNVTFQDFDFATLKPFESPVGFGNIPATTSA